MFYKTQEWNWIDIKNILFATQTTVPEILGILAETRSNLNGNKVGL